MNLNSHGICGYTSYKNLLLNRILNEYKYYCNSMNMSTKIYNPKKVAFDVFKRFEKLPKMILIITFYVLNGLMNTLILCCTDTVW